MDTDGQRRMMMQDCPVCDHRMDAVTQVKYNDQGKVTTAGIPDQPKPGDASVCIKCASILMFNDDLSFRQPSVAELHDLMNNKDSWRVLLRARSIVKAINDA